MIEHKSEIAPEFESAMTTRIKALRTLAEPLIGHAVEGETLAIMIQRVTRKEVALPDLSDELGRPYAEKS